MTDDDGERITTHSFVPSDDSFMQLGRIEIRPIKKQPWPNPESESAPIFGNANEVYINGEKIDWGYLRKVVITFEEGEFATVVFDLCPARAPDDSL